MLCSVWKLCCIHYGQFFHNDESFNTQIIIDSPLAVKLLDAFEENLEDGDDILLKHILQWNNIKVIRNIEDSQHVLKVVVQR